MTPDVFSAAVFDDGARYVHLLAVAIGLGASFFADFSVLRALRGVVTQPFLDILHRCHRLVWVALFGMWVSGIVLIYLRTGFVWENVSPKLMDKVFVVSVLTLNALAISTVAMRRVQNCLGSRILDLPMRTKFPMAIIAGVSTTSWLLALALGSSKVLAASSASLLVPLTFWAYAICVAVSLCAVAVLHFGRGQNSAPSQELSTAVK